MVFLGLLKLVSGSLGRLRSVFSSWPARLWALSGAASGGCSWETVHLPAADLCLVSATWMSTLWRDGRGDEGDGAALGLKRERLCAPLLCGNSIPKWCPGIMDHKWPPTWEVSDGFTGDFFFWVFLSGFLFSHALCFSDTVLAWQQTGLRLPFSSKEIVSIA